MREVVTVAVSECPAAYLDALVLDPCELLSALPITERCESTGDSVRARFSSLLDCDATYSVSSAGQGWELRLASGEIRGACLERLWLVYRGGAVFTVGYGLSGPFFSRLRARGKMRALLEGLPRLLADRCFRAKLAEVLARPRPLAHSGAEAFWEKLGVDLRLDLSSSVVRSYLLETSEEHMAVDGLPTKFYEEKVKKGAWLLVVLHPAGVEYILLLGGVIIGRHAEGERGRVSSVIAYRVREDVLAELLSAPK